jgi:hypothetical protein
MEALSIVRMPTGTELFRLGRNDLHCKIVRSGGYSAWAERLNLKLSDCETRFGNKYESIAKEILEGKGFDVILPNESGMSRSPKYARVKGREYTTSYLQMSIIGHLQDTYLT